MMKYFCFYFPVRTGVLITSFLSILQSMGLLAYCIVNTAEDFKNIATDVKIHIDDYSSNQAFETSLDFVIQRKQIWKCSSKWLIGFLQATRIYDSVELLFRVLTSLLVFSTCWRHSKYGDGFQFPSFCWNSFDFVEYLLLIALLWWFSRSNSTWEC